MDESKDIALKEQLSRCISPKKKPVHSPAEAVFVGRGVFLQQGRELQQRQLLEQIHLEHGLAADLELGRGQAGPVGVLEARPAELLWPVQIEM